MTVPTTSRRTSPRVAVIGAGMGGLSAAADLARQGLEVTVFERAARPGGKLRAQQVGDARVDAGPTVFTMRWVFVELFGDARQDLAAKLDLVKADVLARHAWTDGSAMDLHTDLSASADAIGRFAGAAEARRFLEFSERARRVYQALEQPFLRSPRPTPFSLVRNAGFGGLKGLWGISPFATLWDALGEHFHDPRLRQLFGRYATYCGSSPFQSPATLMLVAHVEADGVWMVRGGMERIAEAVAGLATTAGARIQCDAHVAHVVVEQGRVRGVALADGSMHEADAVVVNADASAVGTRLLGEGASRAVEPVVPAERSLSAVTWTLQAPCSGFAMSRHNVFFSSDYGAEFRQIFREGAPPSEPTVYVCAQDRGIGPDPAPGSPERLLCLVNAPARGDDPSHLGPEDWQRCEQTTFAMLQRCGLEVQRSTASTVRTTPLEFNALFPATGGALYGRASHGWQASFRRPAARTRVNGLYLAGGSVHPGPGVPMAALSGRLAARALMADLGSTARSRRAATSGGTSTR